MPTRPALPMEMPSDLTAKGFGSTLIITGCNQPIVKAALWHGVFLTVAQLTSILLELELLNQLPAKGKGKGKHGTIVKEDKARVLLSHFFPDCDEDNFNRMLAAIMNVKSISLRGEEEVVTHMVSCLDTENCQEFREIARSAKELVQEKYYHKGVEETKKHLDKKTKEALEAARKNAEANLHHLDDAAAVPNADPPPGDAASSSRPEDRVGGRGPQKTPEDFRLLLPHGGVFGVSARHDKDTQRFTISYPCAWVAIIMDISPITFFIE